jgi:hypothetical protein
MFKEPGMKSLANVLFHFILLFCPLLSYVTVGELMYVWNHRGWLAC